MRLPRLAHVVSDIEIHILHNFNSISSAYSLLIFQSEGHRSRSNSENLNLLVTEDICPIVTSLRLL